MNRDTRFESISAAVGMPVWCGRTSGGYGNGPYHKSLVVGDQPDDKVLDHLGGCDVVEKWAEACCSDVSSWHDLNAITPDGDGGDSGFQSRRRAVMDALEAGFPDHPWFWK